MTCCFYDSSVYIRCTQILKNMDIFGTCSVTLHCDIQRNAQSSRCTKLLVDSPPPPLEHIHVKNKLLFMSPSCGVRARLFSLISGGLLILLKPILCLLGLFFRPFVSTEKNKLFLLKINRYASISLRGSFIFICGSVLRFFQFK